MKTKTKKTSPSDAVDFEVFFDDDCPICRREIQFISRKKGAESIRFINISSMTKSELEATGVSFDQLMREIHGRVVAPEVGDWLIGPEVFRQIYGRLGWNRVVGFTRWPIIRHALQLGYHIFAKLRYRGAMKRWAKSQSSSGCNDRECSTPSFPPPAPNNTNQR